MATTIVTTRPLEVPALPATPPSSSHLYLSSSPAVIPNKHLAFPSNGPVAPHDLPSPPESPASPSAAAGPSRLWPADKYQKISQTPLVYAIESQALAEAFDEAATTPLPDPTEVFPWLHGLTAKNELQLSFFKDPTCRPFAGVPACLRGLTIVRAGVDLSTSKLRGAILSDELLSPSRPSSGQQDPPNEPNACFIEHAQGYSVRNFKVQCSKLATCSDIIVYGDDRTPRAQVEALAAMVSRAQDAWNAKLGYPRLPSNRFNTFVLTDSFTTLEGLRPDLIALSSKGHLNDDVMDFPHQERKEMAEMTKVSQIAHNVFLGPSPQLTSDDEMGSSRDQFFDVWVEASDYARIPEQEILEQAEAVLADQDADEDAVALVEFPSSGSFGARATLRSDVNALVGMCEWIHKVANGTRTTGDSDRMEIDDEDQRPARPRKVLIHCSDGYTESSLLALAYVMYAECIPASEAWVRLHRDLGRNFFAYPADKIFLESHAQRTIMWRSPAVTDNTVLPMESPLWMKRMDGSLPSRVLPYLYLGNLTHATNPGLLRRLGITHVLSVGEPVTWQNDPAVLEEDKADWPAENFLYVDQVQDNGVDPLTKDFERCLDFLGM